MRRRKITKSKLIIYPQRRTSDLHQRRSTFHFGWLIDLRAATVEEKEVTDRRPEGGKTLNRKSEGFTLRRLNHFGSRNGGAMKNKSIRNGRFKTNGRPEKIKLSAAATAEAGRIMIGFIYNAGALKHRKSEGHPLLQRQSEKWNGSRNSGRRKTTGSAVGLSVSETL